MAVPIIVQDGAQPYGTPTFTTNVGTYILDDITIDRPSSDAETRAATGAPGTMRVTADRVTGSATLQAPTGTSGWPKFGDYFTLTVDSNYGAEVFAIKPPQYSASNDQSQVRKVPITFFKLYNGSTPTLVNS